MSRDPVDIDELRHDVESAARLAEQDILEREFRRDPDWSAVAKHLEKRDTVGDLCSLIWEIQFSANDEERKYLKMARTMIRLAIIQCARDYAERNVSI